ncbi:hypothetical protein RRG08_029831 [Elysia crispata]|uniref:Uncharacterized protein n=1 Tax=Elysia crispata TaxID=231223 RepID=A0AAE1D188_9GAST|nr:hypothetical protein RRG08_029831 [Elysia crispata]
MTVTEVQGGDDLPEELSRFFRCQASFLDQIVKELSTGDVLQDQISGDNKETGSGLRYGYRLEEAVVFISFVALSRHVTPRDTKQAIHVMDWTLGLRDSHRGHYSSPILALLDTNTIFSTELRPVLLHHKLDNIATRTD